MFGDHGNTAGTSANAGMPRGVDLGAGRNQGLLRHISPRRPAAFPAPAFGLATAPDAVRYGSGARLHFRERDRPGAGASRRARSEMNELFSASNTAADNPGPQTRQSWIDSLNSMEARVVTLERQQQRHADLIGKTDAKFIEQHGRLNEHGHKFAILSEEVQKTKANLSEACVNITKKFASINDVEMAIGQVLEQTNTLRAELQQAVATTEELLLAVTRNDVASNRREPEVYTMQTPVSVRPDRPEPAYGEGPGGQPVWNSRLPEPAFPLTLAGPQSPLRAQEQPYVAPPTSVAQHRPVVFSDGVTDHQGCVQSPTGIGPIAACTSAHVQSQHARAPTGPPASWARQQGAATPPWQGNPQSRGNDMHREDARNAGRFNQNQPYTPEFAGHNKVQYMGNREAMDRKSESLKKYSGNPGEFTNWANRFADHMGRVHGDWKNCLQWVKETVENLSFARLSNEVMGPWNEGACDLARKLEQTIIDYMPEKVYNRRLQLCGGPTQRDNGFIMWRNLHKENVGEGDIIESAGTECLRTYGQCSSVIDLSAHIDGWYELLDSHCPEMRECHRMLRSMFLNIIPKDLKTKILEDPELQLSDHRRLAEWCKARALIQQREHLEKVARSNLSKTYGGSLKALKPADTVPQNPVDEPPMPSWAHALIAAVRPSAPPKKAERGRPERKNDRGPKDRRAPSRSTSRGRKFLEGWGQRCNHCGSTDHLKRECKEFDDMMKRANVGKPKDTWKPPEGYKSALGKARDLAKAAELKKGSKIHSLESGEDTASDDDECDFGSEHGFKVTALTRAPMPSAVPQAPKICADNRF